MLGYGFWERRFGGAADVVGRTLTIEQVPFTIVGVTPSSFFGTNPGHAFDVLVPVGTEPLMRGASTRFNQPALYWLTIMGRLRPGDTIAGVTSTLKMAEREIRETTMPPNFPKEVRDMYLAGREGFLLVPAATGTSGLRARYERPLFTILAVVALVLLIACANIANLLLARATARRHESAVRRALGASRWRLARQLLIESTILAGTGAMAGLAFASVSTRLLIQQLSTRTNAVFLDVSPNLTILMFTAAVTTVAVLLFGIVPALRASDVAPMDALKEGGRGTVGPGLSAANALVVVQVALSIILVVAAGLFLRTFTALESRPLGFAAERLLVANLDAQRVPGSAVARDEALTRIRDVVANVPGVEAAAM
jgi:predicted permease